MILQPASSDTTLPFLRGIGQWLARDPKAAANQLEINKLKEAEYAQEIPPNQVDHSKEWWSKSATI